MAKNVIVWDKENNRFIPAPNSSGANSITQGYFIDNAFYENESKEGLIVPTEENLYLDLTTNQLYHFKNDEYISVGAKIDDTLFVKKSELFNKGKIKSDLLPEIDLTPYAEKKNLFNEENKIKSELLPPIDSGIGKSDQIIPTGQVRKLGVKGARLDITGLENKTDDPASNRILCQNEDGTVGYRTIVANIIIWEDETKEPPNDNNIYIKKLVV